MNKLEIPDSKLDKLEENTFLSGKNTNVYDFTEETQKIPNEANNQNNNPKLIKNIRDSNETYATNLYGNVTNNMIMLNKKSSSQSNTGLFNNNTNKYKKPEAENKNSILNKFRIELNKSQHIINKELIRSKELKLKFLKKRKKQQAEEEAKQLLIKNSPQNLNLINIQNNIINNSTGFKYKTSANFNDTQNKKFESPVKLINSLGENNLDNNYSVKRTTNNNTKEDFFATEVKVTKINNMKNQQTPMIEKNIDKNFSSNINMNTNANNNVNLINNNPAINRNSKVFMNSEKISEINQLTPKERISINSIKKQQDSNLTKGDFSQINQEQNAKNVFDTKKGLNSGNLNKLSETNLTKLLKRDSILNSRIGISTDTISVMENANFNNNNYHYTAILNRPQPAYRVKTYNVKFIKKWFEKNNIPTLANSQQKYANMDFQSNNIIDQIKVLLDNMNYFKLQYLQGKELLTIFQNLDTKRQIKYNKCLEETCGLLMQISKIILMDFSQYLEKFASIEPPAQERLQNQEVKNEEINFFYNIKLFSDCNLFLKGCFEVYLILVKQLDDMIIPPNTYMKLLQYLARARLNISNLIFTAKNAFQNFTADQKNVTKYLDVIATINENEQDPNKNVENTLESLSQVGKKKTALPKINISNNNNNSNKYKTEHVDLTEKIRRQFLFKLNDENQRNLRLNNVLNRKDFVVDDSFEQKKKEAGRKTTKDSCLNSDLITKLLKYCPREVKNQIVSQRIMEMYNDHDFD